MVAAAILFALIFVGYWISGGRPVHLFFIIVPLLGTAFSLSFGASRVHPENLRVDTSLVD